MTSASTYLRTLRHLKPVQVYGRLWHRLARPGLDRRPAPAARARVAPWQPPARRAASLEGATRVRFLNDAKDLDLCGWDARDVSKLWRYNLHYFDDLNALDADARAEWHAALVDRWIAQNPPPAGTGWESYPTALRIANWIKWFIARDGAAQPWLDSLAIQIRWLEKRIEWHLLGNHLFANAKALMLAGMYFDGEESSRWFATGARIVSAELDEQVLADGGHFERSPMYHALFLEDLLDLLNALQAFGIRSDGSLALERRLRTAAERMLRWQYCMLHPDGRIAHFNDAAHGIAPDTAELERYARSLGFDVPIPAPAGATRFGDSGYIRVARGTAVALLDVAPIGPDYLPGHAHADTLSFELSLGSRRVVVNGGTSVYGTGPDRQAERSTSAHSTVEVAGTDSSEVWGGFRVGRRARPFDVVVEGYSVRASHDGYRHLAGAPIVQRGWTLGERELVVEDAVRGGNHPAVSRFLFAPGLRLVRRESDWLVCDERGDDVILARIESGQGTAMRASYAPEFGMRETIDCLGVNLVDGRARTAFEWK